MKRTFLLILILVVFVTTLPAAAQSGLTAEQQEAVQVVADAVQAIRDLDSYTVQASETFSVQMEMAVGQQTLTIHTDMSQSADFQITKTADGQDATGTIVQETVSESGGQTNTVTVTMEIVALEGEGYIRVDGGPGTLGALLPDGWVAMSDPTITDNPALASITVDSFLQAYQQNIPIDETSVLGIEEVKSADIDGQPVRVFEIDYNPQSLIESGIYDDMAETMGGAGNGQNFLHDLFDDTPLIFTAYVGENDGLLYRLSTTMILDATVDIQGTSVPLSLTIDNSTVFSRFNEPVTIIAPVVGT